MSEAPPNDAVATNPEPSAVRTRLTKSGRPRRKPGPPKGVRFGGKQKGTKNKATIAREEAEARELALLREAEAARRAVQDAEIQKATGRPPISGKEALIQLVGVYMALTAFYQPTAPLRVVDGKIVSANPNYDEGMFRYYSSMAKEAASALAPFQHPRYSAMMVGASVVTKVEVTGGMPEDFEPPVPAGEVIDLKPGTVISAEDPAPAPPPKAVNE